MITYCEYKIEETRDETEIIKIYNNKKWTYIGSKYNYKKEIMKFISLIGEEIHTGDVIFVFGFATGEHIFELCKKYIKNTIVVFEPNENLINYAERKIKESNYTNISIINCEEKQLKYWLNKYINEYNYKNSKFACFCNYSKVFCDEYNEYYKIVDEYITELALNVNTKLFFNKIWFSNLINIIPYITNGIPADLYNEKMKNKPAVIVSAGPSLNKNIDLLKEINDNALILVNGRTLGAAIDKNINPDLFVLADTQDRNYELVKQYINNENIPILCYEGSNINVVREYKGPKLFFSYNELIYKIIGKKMKQIYTGGSVAHAMTSYAANLGCNPIIFIGQDFAYTGDKFHAEILENKNGGLKYNDIKSKSDLYVEDINGDMVRTSLVLNGYRKDLEKIIKLYPHVKFINSTEGGASIEGTQVMTLKSAIKKYCNKPFEKIKALKENNPNYKENALRELNKLLTLKNKLENIVTNDKNFVQLSQIIDVFNHNSVYNLLLYNDIYAYRNTENKEQMLNEKKKLYESVSESLSYANDLICRIISELKNNA